MPILRIVQWSGDPVDLARRYDIVRERLQAEGEPAPMLAHAAWAEEGHFFVANVWESEEAAEAAGSRAAFREALESAGFSLDKAETEQQELHNFFSRQHGTT